MGSVIVRSLHEAVAPADAAEIGRLLRLHRDAGSALATELLADEEAAVRAFWAVEPRPAPVDAAAAAATGDGVVAAPGPAGRAARAAPVPATATQPNRPRAAIATGV
jgi:hypothetical protein